MECTDSSPSQMHNTLCKDVYNLFRGEFFILLFYSICFRKNTVYKIVINYLNYYNYYNYTEY